jgi:hypothetical protein
MRPLLTGAIKIIAHEDKTKYVCFAYRDSIYFLGKDPRQVNEYHYP